MAHRLNDLRYPADALEPHLGEAWVRRQREWHGSYVDRLNSLLAGTGFEDLHVEELLRRLRELPEELREPVRENAGGHLNHTLLMTGLSPDGGGEPGYEFLDDIEAEYGSFPSFQAAVLSAAEALDGEGWVWFVWNGHALDLVASELEHNPIDRHHTPLLGVDLWEHACDGFPSRAAYLHAFWNVVDWRTVAERFLEAEEVSRERGEVR
jgi:Fe-Mn family superoxide dismutase